MPSGPRIRTNNVYGTVDDNPLTNNATTLNSAGLADLAAVSSAHAVIILDPLRAAGAPEAVIVTAHTGSATSATITRGAYGTSARQHAAGTLWVHAPTIEDFIRIVTSSTRPSDPYEGQLVYETDTDSYKGYSGSAWEHGLTLGAWTSYTPTNNNITIGNGTQVAKYARIGRTVHVFYRLTFGSTTSIITPEIGLPFAAAENGIYTFGSAFCFDTSASAQHVGIARPQSTVLLRLSTDAGTVTSTSPFTWATGDILSLTATYEAAA